MYKYTQHKGFTLVEIMVVILIIGILGSALYIGVNPYMMRSRDTKRVANMLSYTNVLETYEKNFDTFPSNAGSGDIFTSGYCLTELGERASYPASGKDQQFSSLNNGASKPPVDPVATNIRIGPCDIDGSFLYSRIKYGSYNENEIAILAARLELRTSANYGTGMALTGATDVQAIIAAKKGTVPDGAPDALYVVSIIR